MAVISAPWMIPLLMSAGTGGCVIPPPIDPGGADAGPSSPPVIEAASPIEFAFPGVMVLDRGDQRRLSLTLSDGDLDDTLYVRLFVDYGLPAELGYSSDCNAPPSGGIERVADCSVASLCNRIEETDTEKHFLEAMVADRGYLSESDPRAESQPAFRAVPEDAGYSFRSWIMKCNPPQ